jgi:hypothetical protein
MKHLKAKMAGICAVCGGRFFVGENIRLVEAPRNCTCDIEPLNRRPQHEQGCAKRSATTVSAVHERCYQEPTEPDYKSRAAGERDE